VSKSSCLLVLSVLSLSSLFVNPAVAQYRRVDLVSNVSGQARHTDPNQINGWGLAFFPDGPFWVADNGTGLSSLYGPLGAPVPLVVTVPPAPSQPFGPIGSPTGLVANASTDFVISENNNSGAAAFIFDTEDGTISGWNPSVDATNAVIAVDNSGQTPPPFYTGLAIGADRSGNNFIYAADQANNKVDIYGGSFNFVKSFTDPNLPPGYAAFGIQNIGGKLFVTFAGFFSGNVGGFVDVFDTSGNFIKNFASMGELNLPWGLALAPADFGKFSQDLLVGNLGDGLINAFRRNGKFVGPLKDDDGTRISIDGLWALAFGTNPSANGKRNQLFFTAGPLFYTQGVFGGIEVDEGKGTPQPEPQPQPRKPFY
jgi:uncharacterized protein (TIGR03118 family)